MTTRRQHQQQACANIGLHDLLAQRNEHLDWAVTALFYAVLHYMDACLLPRYNPPDHGTRNKFIRRTPELRSVFPDYRVLQEKSRDARYECFDPTPHELEQLRTQTFEPLQSHLLQVLRSSP